MHFILIKMGKVIRMCDYKQSHGMPLSQAEQLQALVEMGLARNQATRSLIERMPKEKLANLVNQIMRSLETQPPDEPPKAS